MYNEFGATKMSRYESECETVNNRMNNKKMEAKKPYRDVSVAMGIAGLVGSYPGNKPSLLLLWPPPSCA